MTTYNVLIEGQTMTLPPGIEKDEDIRRALAPYFPEVSTALLTRKEEGEVVTITIVKRAGSKGSTDYENGLHGLGEKSAPLKKLRKCEPRKNPAIALYEEIDALGAGVDIVDLLAFEGRIDKALEEGARQRSEMDKALKRLAAAASQPAPAVVLGF